MIDPGLPRARTMYLHAAVVGLGQAGAQAVSALVFLVLARSLSVASFGHIAAIYGVSLLVSILADFGASSLWVRQLSSGTPVDAFIASLRSRLWACAALLVIIGVLSGVLSAPWTWFWVVASGCAVGIGRVASCPARARNHLGRLAGIAVFEKAVLLVFVVLIGSAMSVTTFLMGAACAALLSLSVTVVVSLQHAPLGTLLARRAGWSNPLAGTLHLGLGAVAIGIQSLDTLVLQVAAGSQVAGTYAAVGRWTQPMGLLASAVTQGNYADMARERTHHGAAVLLRRSVVLLSVSCVPVAVLGVFAGDLVNLLLGSQYASSAGVLRLLAVAAILNTLCAPFLVFLQARGGERWTAGALMGTVPVQMALMGVAAAASGAQAAAAVVVGFRALLFLVLLLGVWRLLGRRRRQRTSVPVD